MDDITLRAVGLVSSPVTQRTDQDWGQIRSKIILDTKPYFPYFDRIEAPRVPG